nr:tetratricopeptide repeat protein [Bacteroidota bacterium]
MIRGNNGISNSLNNLGIVYAKTMQYQKALDHFRLALEMKNAMLDENHDMEKIMQYQSGSYNNIGLIYDQIGKYDSALYFYNKSINIKRTLSDYRGIAESLQNIGVTYLNLNDFTKARDCLQRAYQIADSLSNIFMAGDITYNLAEMYFRQGQNDSAVLFINKCLAVAWQLDSKDLLAGIYELMAKISFNKKEFGQAYTYLQTYNQINDSLLTEEMESRIANLQIAHEVLQKEEKIALLSKEKEIVVQRGKFKDLVLMFLVLFLLVALGAMLIIFHQKKKVTATNKSLMSRNLELMAFEKKGNRINAEKRKKYLSSSLSDETRELVLVQFSNLMEDEQIFTQADLTIEKVATRLQISRTYLSQIVNEEFNANFTNLINKYRISHAREMLSDKSNDRYSIAGIAEISGFNSISSFNTMFKQITGLTPSLFRKLAAEKDIEI